MYAYIIGKVVEIENVSIVIDNNGIGFRIFVPNPYSFKQGEEEKVYLYQQIKEDEHNLFGFKNKEERDMFLKLISVKGIGPKMALPMLATGSISGIADAIERENILYLKKFPKIGDKVAKQIILDLKGKLNIDISSVSGLEELSDVLIGLGYKEKEFKHVIGKVNKDLSIEEQIKEALKLLLK